ncbi:MAG: cyclase family protein [Pseudomonadota bacterium]
MISKFTFAEQNFNLFDLAINEHIAARIDVPSHFSDDGASVDETPIGDLVIPLCVVDIAARGEPMTTHRCPR